MIHGMLIILGLAIWSLVCVVIGIRIMQDE